MYTNSIKSLSFSLPVISVVKLFWIKYIIALYFVAGPCSSVVKQFLFHLMPIGSRPHMLTYSTFKLTLYWSFHLLPLTHFIMRVYDAMFVDSLLKPNDSDNKHELTQVVVPANITILTSRTILSLYSQVEQFYHYTHK